MHATTKATKIVSWRPTGVGVRAEAVTIEAVRNVIADWDGVNWAAVRAVLENAGLPMERIDAMHERDVRQYFAVGQRRMILVLGGQCHTATNTIVSGGTPSTKFYVPHNAGATLPPAIDKAERKVLLVMARFDASQLLTIPDIVQADGGGERTVGPALTSLIQKKLAERPEGDKDGARLTKQGRAMARELSE